jgi:hypothetical protein
VRYKIPSVPFLLASLYMMRYSKEKDAGVYQLEDTEPN